MHTTSPFLDDYQQTDFDACRNLGLEIYTSSGTHSTLNRAHTKSLIYQQTMMQCDVTYIMTGRMTVYHNAHLCQEAFLPLLKFDLLYAYNLFFPFELPSQQALALQQE